MGDDMCHIVNMSSKNCTCPQWQLDGMPCIHAMSAITHRGESPEQTVTFVILSLHTGQFMSQ